MFSLILVVISGSLFFLYSNSKNTVTTLREQAKNQNTNHEKMVAQLREQADKQSKDSEKTIVLLNDQMAKQSEQLSKLGEELKIFKPIKDLDKVITDRKKELSETEQKLLMAKQHFETLSIDIEIVEMGYYSPKFVFEDVLQYAEALDLIRASQKELLRKKSVIVSTIGGSIDANIGKLAVSAFTGEANEILKDVTYSNFEKSKEKLILAYDKINHLIEDYNVKIFPQYLELKLQEMAVAYDYEQAEFKARQEQLELKQAMQEEEKARAEAEKAREKAISEQEKYEQALSAARKEIEGKNAEEKAEYERRIAEIQQKLNDATAERERATSMAQITKEGHVYIISNIGSFGENIFKIGMTRRKDPDDRIRELGDASVPFGFDVHALVKTKDAPALENALHGYFEKKRMNKVNLRKEFFRASISEISDACKSLGHEIRLTLTAEAREYRQTVALEQTNDEAKKAA